MSIRRCSLLRVILRWWFVLTDLDDYTDLGEWEETHKYECQRCGHRTKNRFLPHNCPACDSPRYLCMSTEWAKAIGEIDEEPDRTVGL